MARDHAIPTSHLPIATSYTLIFPFSSFALYTTVGRPKTSTLKTYDLMCKQIALCLPEMQWLILSKMSIKNFMHMKFTHPFESDSFEFCYYVYVILLLKI